MTARSFVYGLEHPVTGEKTGTVGMITILKEEEMDRVPEGAIEVGDNPVPEDKETHVEKLVFLSHILL